MAFRLAGVKFFASGAVSLFAVWLALCVMWAVGGGDMALLWAYTGRHAWRTAW